MLFLGPYCSWLPSLSQPLHLLCSYQGNEGPHCGLQVLNHILYQPWTMTQLIKVKRGLQTATELLPCSSEIPSFEAGHAPSMPRPSGIKPSLCRDLEEKLLLLVRDVAYMQTWESANDLFYPCANHLPTTLHPCWHAPCCSCPGYFPMVKTTEKWQDRFQGWAKTTHYSGGEVRFVFGLPQHPAGSTLLQEAGSLAWLLQLAARSDLEMARGDRQQQLKYSGHLPCWCNYREEKNQQWGCRVLLRIVVA